jgi:hypothetical protein
MTLYQVKDWNDHFENNKSRERDECSFVCVPNKQHGLGFSRIMAEKDGACIYGIWCAILGACSQQKKPREGWLTDDGHPTGTAWTPDDLALKFRRPASEIRRAFDFLCSPKIGWLLRLELAEDGQLVTSALEVPAECPSDALERREGIEEKGKNVGSNGGPLPTSNKDLSQDDWLKGLAAEPAYEGLDVPIQFGRMVQWCKANNKSPSRRRFINWLNRCDKPVTGGATKTDHAKGF